MRFSIRDLLWGTLVIGLALGWWLDHSGLSRRLEVAEGWEEAATGLAHNLRESGFTVEVKPWGYSIDSPESLPHGPWGSVTGRAGDDVSSESATQP